MVANIIAIFCAGDTALFCRSAKLLMQFASDLQENVCVFQGVILNSKTGCDAATTQAVADHLITVFSCKNLSSVSVSLALTTRAFLTMKI